MHKPARPGTKGPLFYKCMAGLGPAGPHDSERRTNQNGNKEDNQGSRDQGS